jgi:large subunit ribosomal protein L15
MHLNTLKPAKGAKHSPKRVGRGMGSGLGKTCGRGHKGQRARSGGYHKLGFEGGQMPLQRRVPKFGFNSGIEKAVELRLHDLVKINVETIDMLTLKAKGLISKNVNRVKIILSGKIEKAVVIKGIPTTAGAKKAIEAVGGQVQEW